METARRNLLGGLIDYAGMFPPAALSLPEALHNYLAYRQQAEGWLLGRLVCPLERLAELRRLAARRFSEPIQVPLAVVGSRQEQVSAFLEQLRWQLAQLADFQSQPDVGLCIETLEIPLPVAVVSESEEKSADILAQVNELLESHLRAPLTPFYELPWEADWRQKWQRLWAGLALAGAGSVRGAPAFQQPAGIKVRCGGPAPQPIPSAEQLAFVLCQCRDRGLAWKATAGLHHAWRHWEASRGQMAPGFLLLFLAAVLAASCRLTEEQVRTLLEKAQPEDFLCTAEELRWRQYRLAANQIRQARQRLAQSFGSCSFTEPVAELQALGWL